LGACCAGPNTDFVDSESHSRPERKKPYLVEQPGRPNPVGKEGRAGSPPGEAEPPPAGEEKGACIGERDKSPLKTLSLKMSTQSSMNQMSPPRRDMLGKSAPGSSSSILGGPRATPFARSMSASSKGGIARKSVRELRASGKLQTSQQYLEHGKNVKKILGIVGGNSVPSLLGSLDTMSVGTDRRTSINSQTPATPTSPHSERKNSMLQYLLPRESQDGAMPEDDDLDDQFRDFMEEKLFSAAAQETLMKLPREKKWMMIVENRKVKKRNAVEWVQILFSPDLNTKQLSDLRIELQGAGKKFLEDWIQAQGLRALLQKMDNPRVPVNVRFALCEALTAFANNSFGLTSLIKLPQAINSITGVLVNSDVRMKKKIVQLLIALSFESPEGHKAVMDAFAQSKFKRRFKILIDMVDEEKDLTLRVDTATLLNTLVILNQTVEEKVKVRYELLDLKYREVLQRTSERIGKLKGDGSIIYGLFRTQKDVFEEEMKEDQREALFNATDLTDIDEVFLYMRNFAAQTGHSHDFLSLLHPMMKIPFTKEGDRTWKDIQYIVHRACDYFWQEESESEDIQEMKMKMIEENKGDVKIGEEDEVYEEADAVEIPEALTFAELVAELKEFKIGSRLAEREAEAAEKDKMAQLKAENHKLKMKTSTLLDDIKKQNKAMGVERKNSDKTKAAFEEMKKEVAKYKKMLEDEKKRAAEEKAAMQKKIKELNDAKVHEVKKAKEEASTAATATATPLKADPAEIKKLNEEIKGLKKQLEEAKKSPPSTGKVPPPPGGGIPPVPGAGIPPVPGAGGVPPPPGAGVIPPPPGAGVIPPPPGGAGIPPPPGAGIPPPPGGGGIPPPPMLGGIPPPPGGGGIPPPPMMGGVPPPPGIPGVPAPPGIPGVPGIPGLAPPPMFGVPSMMAAPKINLPYTKKKIETKAKLKALHWKPIDAEKIEKTFWFKLSDQKVDFDAKEFETMFSVKKRKAKAKTGASSPKPGGKKKKKEVINLIDSKRSYNISIALARFKMSHAEIRDALFRMDSGVLSEDKLATLAKCKPEPEEIDTVQHFDGEKSHLGQCEQFFLTISEVYNINFRIESFLYMARFKRSISELKDTVSSLRNAHKCLKESTNFQRVLEYILALGNYLNCKSKKKGGVYGIYLSSLDKIKGLKSTDGKSNLMEYLVITLSKAEPEARNFIDEFKILHEAARVDIAFLEAAVSKNVGFVRKIGNAAKKAEEKDASKDRYGPVMQEFFDKANEEVTNLQDSTKAIVSDFNELILLYGEPKKTKINEFLQMFMNFAGAFSKVEEIINKKKELENRQKSRQKQPSPKPTKKKDPNAGKFKLPGMGSKSKLSPTKGLKKRKDKKKIQSAMNSLRSDDSSKIRAALKRRAQSKFGTIKFSPSRKSSMGVNPMTRQSRKASTKERFTQQLMSKITISE